MCWLCVLTGTRVDQKLNFYPTQFAYLKYIYENVTKRIWTPHESLHRFTHCEQLRVQKQIVRATLTLIYQESGLKNNLQNKCHNSV